MSYMRGKYYIWTSGSTAKDSRIHLWVGGEPEETMMKDSGWAEEWEVDKVMGCSLPEKIFDELVVMRFAEIEKEGKLVKTEARALKKWGGNVGCFELQHKYGVPTFLDEMNKEKRAPGRS